MIPGHNEVRDDMNNDALANGSEKSTVDFKSAWIFYASRGHKAVSIS